MARTNKSPADSPEPDADAPAVAEEAKAEEAETDQAEDDAGSDEEAIEETGAEPEVLEDEAEDEDGAAAEVLEDGGEDEDGAEDAGEADESLDESTEPEAAPAPRGRLGRLRGRVRLPKLSTLAQAAAILLILAFVTFSGYTLWEHHDVEQRQERTAAFVAGAKRGVVNMTSLDFNKAKEDVQRVIDSSTGEFKDDFARRAADFTKVIEQSKVVTEGTVNAAALVSMDEDSAVVLVSATSHITSSAGSKNGPLPWRLRVTVTEEGGQYKMSKVEFVQ
jgi:Mce-associated membrane protein